jgi:hypothetical protein
MFGPHLARSRGQALRTLFWLGPIALGWRGLAVLSHGVAYWRIIWVNRLFLAMLVLTYLLIMGWSLALSQTRKFALFRRVATTLSLVLGWLGLELVGSLHLIDWQVAIRNLFRELRYWSDPMIPNKAPYFGFLHFAYGAPQCICFADYAAVPWSDWIADRWSRAQASLRQGASFCRQSGSHLLVCYLPIKFRVYHRFVEFPPDSPCE